MELAEEVDRYLGRSGMSATRFGRLVARDPSLVPDLRRGRRPMPTLRRRILAQIGQPTDMAGNFISAFTVQARDHGYRLHSPPRATPWASAGYVGDQVECRLAPDENADRDWPASLPDRSWDLPFLVADLAIERRGDDLLVIALLLPDA